MTDTRTVTIQHFLLVFDHSRGELIELAEFGDDGDRAVARYAEKEQEYQGRKDIDIVLVGSDSLETVRLTPANYFNGTAAISRYLVGCRTPSGRPASRFNMRAWSIHPRRCRQTPASGSNRWCGRSPCRPLA